MTLSAPTGGATLGTPSTAVLTITDNDVAPPGTLQFSAATYSVAENGSTATITVTRTGGSGGAVGVTLRHQQRHRHRAGDYTAVTQTVNFAAGDTATRPSPFPSSMTPLVEGNETVNVTLSAPTGGRDARHAEHGGAHHHRQRRRAARHAAAQRRHLQRGREWRHRDDHRHAHRRQRRRGGRHATTSNGTATAPADYTAVTPDGQLCRRRHGQQDRHHSDRRRRAGRGRRDGECGAERAHRRRHARHVRARRC